MPCYRRSLPPMRGMRVRSCGWLRGRGDRRGEERWKENRVTLLHLQPAQTDGRSVARTRIRLRATQYRPHREQTPSLYLSPEAVEYVSFFFSPRKTIRPSFQLNVCTIQPPYAQRECAQNFAGLPQGRRRLSLSAHSERNVM